MNTFEGFLRSQAAAAAGDPQKVFDWDKAARIMVERGASSASAGLIEDWDCTAVTILEYGKPVPHEDGCYWLSSNWATPTLVVYGDHIDCWRYADDAHGWGPKTMWPDSAVAILRAGTNN